MQSMQRGKKEDIGRSFMIPTGFTQYDLKRINEIKGKLFIDRMSGSNNLCLKCGKSGNFGSIMKFDIEGRIILICGWCQTLSCLACLNTLGKTKTCSRCKSYLMAEVAEEI